MPARTLEGIRAKVVAAMWLYNGDTAALEEDPDDGLKSKVVCVETLQVSILRDLARMGGEA